MIIGEIPEQFQSKIDELKAEGAEIVCLKDTDEFVEARKSMRIGVIGSGFIGAEPKEKVVIVDDADEHGSFESIYGKPPTEIVMKYEMRKMNDIDVYITHDYNSRNRYKKREYKLSAGKPNKNNKKRK